MKLTDLPPIYNIDKVRIYIGNEIMTEFWCESPRVCYWAIHTKLKEMTIDSFNIVLGGISVEVIILEIYLK